MKSKINELEEQNALMQNQNQELESQMTDKAKHLTELQEKYNFQLDQLKSTSIQSEQVQSKYSQQNRNLQEELNTLQARADELEREKASL